MSEIEYFTMGVKSGAIIQTVFMLKRVVDWVSNLNPFNWFREQ